MYISCENLFFKNMNCIRTANAGTDDLTVCINETGTHRKDIFPKIIFAQNRTAKGIILCNRSVLLTVDIGNDFVTRNSKKEPKEHVSICTAVRLNGNLKESI